MNEQSGLSNLSGKVVVLLDNGSAHGAHVAKALAEAGVSVMTLHGQGRPPEGRAVFAGDPADPVDVDAAQTMASELFGRVDAVIDVADLPEDPSGAIDTVAARLA